MANSTLTNQLRALAHLTWTEAQIARFRVAQARTDTVSRELQDKAADSDRRYERIVAVLDQLGAVPDVVTPMLGRVLAFVRGIAEQAQPIDEALLGDLALEHQLHDRARYVRTLAQRAGRPDIEMLADDLVEAHSATVEWLITVLAEEGLGGPAALRPTPLQRFAAGFGTVLTGPVRFAVEQVNRTAQTVRRTGGQARDAALGTAGELRDRAVQTGQGLREGAGQAREAATSTAGDLRDRAVETGQGLREGAEQAAATAGRVGRDAAEVAEGGRDAALQRAEQVAEREGAERTAEAVHETRRDLGVLEASELPIPQFDEMTAHQAIAAIRELDDPDDINAVIAYEEAHENRAGVVEAARTRYAAIAEDAAGVT